MKKIILPFSIFFFVCLITNGQYLKSNRLFAFLQNNFDTTIVFYPFSNWYASPDYTIISKKGSEIYSFTYRSPHDLIKKYPDSLRDRFIQLESKFRATEPDVNEFFLPKQSTDSLSRIFWTGIFNNGIWNLTSTRENVICIAKDSSRYDIDDGDEEYFFLITKSANKPIYFYAPAYYEEHCPGDINRIRAIKTMKLFNSFFTKD